MPSSRHPPLLQLQPQQRASQQQLHRAPLLLRLRRRRERHHLLGGAAAALRAAASVGARRRRRLGAALRSCCGFRRAATARGAHPHARSQRRPRQRTVRRDTSCTQCKEQRTEERRTEARLQELFARVPLQPLRHVSVAQVVLRAPGGGAGAAGSRVLCHQQQRTQPTNKSACDAMRCLQHTRTSTGVLVLACRPRSLSAARSYTLRRPRTARHRQSELRAMRDVSVLLRRPSSSVATPRVTHRAAASAVGNVPRCICLLCSHMWLSHRPVLQQQKASVRRVRRARETRDCVSRRRMISSSAWLVRGRRTVCRASRRGGAAWLRRRRRRAARAGAREGKRQRLREKQRSVSQRRCALRARHHRAAAREAAARR
jgi:hypothetical protein